jgi:hypothetical protein
MNKNIIPYRGLLGASEFSVLSLPELRLWSDPTDQSVLNDGTAIDLDPISKIDDKSGLNNTSVQVTVTKQPIWKEGKWLHCDGTSDNLNINTLIGDIATDTKGYWNIWLKPDTIKFQYIFMIADEDTSVILGFYMNGTGKLVCIGGDNGNDFTLISDANIFSAGVSTMITIVQDGTEVKMYQDKALVAATFSIDTNKAFWVNSDANLDIVRQGCRNFDSLGDINFFDGRLGELVVGGADLTVEQITELYDTKSDVYI